MMPRREIERRHLRAALLALAGLACGNAHGGGTTFNVPGDFPTIQAGLDGASPGDTVLVAPGTYFETEINFNGKDVELRSSGGRDVTIIDGQNLAMVFRIQQGEGRGCIIDGFTIQNGSAQTFAQGGAFFIGSHPSNGGSSPTIRNNRIINNENMIIQFGPDPMDDADDDFGNGGGIKISGDETMSPTNPLIENNIISDNVSIGSGGGIRAREASAEIRNNVFEDNLAMGGTVNGVPDSNGGALSLSRMESVVVDGNTFNNNIASSVAGALSSFDANATITNNDFTGNSAPFRAGAIRLEDERNVGARTMTIQGNTFRNNTTEGKGGAIAAFFEAGDVNTMSGGSTYSVIDNQFIGNTALNPDCTADLDPDCANSGALQVTRNNAAAGTMLVRDNVFDGNSADENGAAQFNKPDVIFEDNQVLNNSARFRYSGVSCQHRNRMPCVIRRNVFVNNASTESAGTGRDAGGVYLKDVTGATIENNWFIDNAGDRGGAVYYLGVSATFANNTFLDNLTAFAGGASLYINGDAGVYNNIFDGDTRGVRLDDPPTQILDLRDNNFFNQSTSLVRLETTELSTIGAVNAESFASGNVEMDPQYVDRNGNDLKLDSISQLIDACQCALAASDDIDGEIRPLGSGCDIGADEFDPLAADRVFMDGFEE